MKILKNNCNTTIKEKSNKPIVINCSECDSKLEITEEDTHIGWLGAAYVTCPCCGEETMVCELDGITVTKDNVEYPAHFCRTNKNLRNVTEVEIEEVNKTIKECIDYLNKNRDEFYRYISFGDLLVVVFNHSDDGEYFVVVTRDFYEGYVDMEL